MKLPTSTRDKFIFAVFINLFILAALIVYHSVTLLTGTSVTLAIAPVDPTDPFRGDYITFEYDIEKLTYEDANITFFPAMPVYVPLKTSSSGLWTSTGQIYMEPPEEGVFMKGYVSYTWKDTVHIDYKMNSFFIPEGVGRDMNFSDFEMTAEVILRKNGTAQLNQVFLDGEPWP